MSWSHSVTVRLPRIISEPISSGISPAVKWGSTKGNKRAKTWLLSSTQNVAHLDRVDRQDEYKQKVHVLSEQQAMPTKPSYARRANKGLPRQFDHNDDAVFISIWRVLIFCPTTRENLKYEKRGNMISDTGHWHS